MRNRRSIFGGLLLILIGVLFLIHYMQPGLIHLGEIIRFWPVLLILWGLARLWDYYAARRADQPPPRMLGGGLVVVVLVVIGVVAFVVYNHTRRNMNYGLDLFENPYTFTNTLPTVPVDAASQIDLWTPRGNISVRPQDSTNLNVVVTKTVRAANQTDAQKVADATTVAQEKTARGIRVEPQIPSGGEGELVSYDARLFAKTSLSASTGRGNLHISGINGEVSASASGDVDMSSIGSNIVLNIDRGNLHLQSVGGNVTVHGRAEQMDLSEITGKLSLDGMFFGPTTIRQAAKGLSYRSRRTRVSVDAPLGRVEIDSGRLVVSDTAGSVTTNTRDKDIRIENVRGIIKVTDRNGDIDVRFSQLPRNNIDITNRSGNINLVLPERSAFSVTAMARTGDITSAFQAPTLRLVKETANAQLEGSVGTGGPKFVLNTSYGTIRITRTPPAPPMPPMPPVPPAPPTAGTPR